MAKEPISQATEDALVTMIMQQAVRNGSYGALMKQAGKHEKSIEECIDRHAARRRAAGERGW